MHISLISGRVYQCYTGKIFTVEPITSESPDKSVLTIYAGEIDISQKNVPYDVSVQVPSKTHFVVYADIINITGPLVNRGKSIKFIARQIIFNKALNASIDTSGLDGHIKYPPLSYGQNGNNGGNGTDGGNVTLVADEILGPVVIRSKGGAGQTGQNGAKGQDGARGRDAKVNGCSCVKERTNGGPGMNGGNGGNGGFGGNSGNVSIEVAKTREVGPLTVNSSGGARGETGSPGEGGRGGEAGNGYFCCRPLPYAPEACPICLDWLPEHGKNGVKGHYGKPGSQGKSGNFTVNSGELTPGRVYPVNSTYHKVNLTELEEDIPVGVFTTMLRSANSFYINLDLYKATTEEIQKMARKYMIIVNFTNAITKLTTPDDKQKASINNEAKSRLLQLQQGLDFYGNVYNYVPVLSLKAIEDFLTNNIPIANDIFVQLGKFESKEMSEKERIAALRETVAKTQLKITSYEKHLDQIRRELLEERDTVNYLYDQIQQQITVVSKAEEDVKRAIVQKTRFETFEAFLDGFEAIVGIGEAVAENVNGLNELLNGIGGLVGVLDNLESFQNLLDNITQFYEKAESTFNDIKDTYDKIKGFIDEDYPDKAKVLVDKEKTDALLSELVSDLPAAEELKAQMDMLFDLEQTRNKRILDFDTKIIESVKVQTQINQLKASIQVIQAELLTNQDPTTALYVSFMQHAYQEIAENLLKQLYDMHSAYNYWALQDTPFCVPPIGADGNIGFLIAFEQLSNSIQQQQKGISQAPQHIENRHVIVSRSEHDFSSLDTTGLLNLNISSHHPAFADVYQVAVTKVRVDFPGYVPTQGTLSVGLKLIGDVAVKNSTGGVHYYAHNIRVAEYGYNYATKEVTTDGNLAGAG